ncbi:N-acetylmuramoyl-L-alanine amidase family protein [Aestuariivivens insulae]|uniref:N-acetylmuramoyl-L-alanine amidase family protein n=1 Tax=Aestuariivivens insulae TaxID=1621988 RepID=UPI001F560519|nr:N-acetylmuramoyl-L-alanine amidase [Aestuariivivens insulae]
MLNKLPFFILFILFSLQTIAQSKAESVIAQKGDGIYSLLRSNGLDPTKYFQQFIDLNKLHLNPNYSLVAGKAYILPKPEIIIEDPKTININDSIPSKPLDSLTFNKINYPLFGEQHSTFEQESSILDGAIYYLISGHGGPDPGAITSYNNKTISEDEYAYDVTLRLAKFLLANGAKVYIIIKDENDGIRDQRILEMDDDEVCYLKKRIPLNQTLRLRQRTRAVNTLYMKHKGAYQRLIVTHVDSRNVNKNIDVFFYHHKNSKSGKRLATNIYESFKEKYAEHQPNREYAGSVSPRHLYLIRNTFPPMVYIELGNIKNGKDQKRILDYGNRQALAHWIFNGLLKDFTEN